VIKRKLSGKLSRVSQAAIVGSSYNCKQILVLPKELDQE
jgi:hypothetical protein